MSVIEERLKEMGVEIPEVAAPAAAYIPAIKIGDLVYTSGQLPFIDGKLPTLGKVGKGEGLVDPEVAQQMVQTCAINALAAVKDLIGSLDKIKQVVKVTAFVASDPEFTGQPIVANGASLFLGETFGDKGVHSRSAVGVAVLPFDSPVEAEFIFQIESD